MIVNIKTDYRPSEIEYILNLQNSVGRAKKSIDYGLGINWVSNKSKRLCLFYNDGAKDRWGYQSLLRAYFYGKVISTKNGCRVVGIVCPKLSYLISAFIIFLVFVFGVFYDPAEYIIGIIFFAVVLVLLNFNIPKGIREIHKYLEGKFSGGSKMQM